MEIHESPNIPKVFTERLKQRGQKILELVSDRWLIIPGKNQGTPSFRNHIEELAADKEETSSD